MYYFTCFFSPWGLAAVSPATWETVNDSCEHPLKLKDFLTPTWSPFLNIPRYQQSQLTCANAQGKERDTLFSAHWLYHLTFAGFFWFCFVLAKGWERMYLHNPNTVIVLHLPCFMQKQTFKSIYNCTLDWKLMFRRGKKKLLEVFLHFFVKNLFWKGRIHIFVV